MFKLHLHNDVLAVLILATTSLVLYSNTFSAGYVWDDRAAIINNRDVHTNDLLQLWRHDFWGQDITLSDSHKSYRPLTVLSYRVNYAIHKFRASGYHITSVLLHIGVVCLFFKFCLRFTSQFGAFLAALLFAVHPIHVESVASLVGRADVLCGFFYLLALINYHTYATSLSSWHISAAYIFALCSCLAKELGFTIFGLFVVIDILQILPPAVKETAISPVSFASSLRHLIAMTLTRLTRSPLLLCRMLISLLYLVLLLSFRRWLHGNELYPWTIMENHISLLPALHRVLSYAQTHVWYAAKLFYPYHLCFDYGYHCLPVIRSVFNVLNALPLSLYILTLLLLLWSLKHHRNMLFSLCLLLFPLLPALNILFPVGTTLAERLLYIPSMGYCLCIGIALDSIWLKRLFHQLETIIPATSLIPDMKSCPLSYKSITVMLLLPILLSQAYVVVSRNIDWHSEKQLFASALRVCPNSFKALNNNGMMELSFGNLTIARESLSRALEVHAQQASAYINLGIVEQRLGHFAESIYAQQQAISISQSAKPFGYMAQAMNLWSEEINTLPEAKQYLQQQAAAAVENAFDLGWAPPSMLFLRANLFINDNNPSAAIPLLEQTLQLVQAAKAQDKDVPAQDMVSEIVIYNQLAVCYIELNRDADAEMSYLLAIMSDDNRFEPHVNVASLYRSQQRHSEAVQHMRAAEDILLRAGSEVPLSVLYNAGLVYTDSGDYEMAKSKWRLVQSMCQEVDAIRVFHTRECREVDRLLQNHSDSNLER